MATKYGKEIVTKKTSWAFHTNTDQIDNLSSWTLTADSDSSAINRMVLVLYV